MASQQLITVISFLLISSTLASINAVQVAVEGMVYCQTCKGHKTWSFNDAKPIPAAKVSVTCTDHKHNVTFYKTFATDARGHFYAQLDGFKMSHILDHPLHSCLVRLVSSPLPECNVPTNMKYGIKGASLRYEKKRLFGNNYEAVVYAAGPLAFRPNSCY